MTTPPDVLAAMRHYDATGDAKPLALAVHRYWDKVHDRIRTMHTRYPRKWRRR